MKRLSIIIAIMMVALLAVSVNAVFFTDVENYASFELGGDPCYIMDDYSDVADYYAGAWDSAGENGDTLTTVIVDGAGYNGSKAIGVSSDGTSNAGLYLYATDKNGIQKGYAGQTCLRVWCDFSNVAFRKANFGVVTVEDDSYTIWTADEPNAEGSEGYQSFWYSPDGVNWEEWFHGGDGCFGDAQDSDVYGLKGFFAFPLDTFFVRSNCNWNAYDEGSTPDAANIVGVYLFWDYSDNYADEQGNMFYLDNIEFVTDYKAFDYDATIVTASAPAAGADSATAEDGSLLAKAVYGTPAIDGKIDDCWANAPVYKIERLKDGSATDIKAQFRTMWDEANIYVLIEVEDAEHSFEGGASVGDGAEVYFDFNNLKSGSYEEEGQAYFAQVANDPAYFSTDGEGYGRMCLEGSASGAIVETDTGFLYEYAVNVKDEWEYTFAEGRTIGFDIQINDQDNGDTSRTGAYGWNDDTNAAWQSPASFGTVKFVKNASDSVGAAAPAASGSNGPAVAHWKFQNNSEYYTGSVDDDNITFIDLTGNGNDLKTAVEGNGADLDIFTWDDGCDIPEAKSDSSFKMANTLANAKSVDPYDAADTDYNGGYTSGKYLETVDGAPMNAMSFAQGWTVEIIFKIDPEWNTNYNRYVGVFSRQGVLASADEPPFTLALTSLEAGGEEDGTIRDGQTGLQYVHLDPDGNKTNQEYQNGAINANQWIHFMATSDGDLTEIYIDGENVAMIGEVGEILVTDPSYSWEVGVGRKLGEGKATKNELYPEGLIRRLFCGSISEIRVSEGYMDVNDSLFFGGSGATTLSEAPAAADTPAATGEAVEPAMLWDFNGDEAMSENMGANSMNGVDYYGENNYYVFMATSNDPYVSVDMGAESVDDIAWVKARVYNPSSATAIELFGATDGRGLSGPECTHIDIKPATESWEEYITYIPTANIETANTFKGATITECYWTGEVNWIRLDPMWHEGDDGSDSGGSMEAGEEIWIDYIAFFPTEEAAKAYTGPVVGAKKVDTPESDNYEICGPTPDTYPGSGIEGEVLTGNVIGIINGWDGTAACGSAAAYDGSISTYFDPLGVADGWAGIDVGEKVYLSKIAICPRNGWLDRFAGGTFEATNTPDDDDSWVELWSSDSAGETEGEYIIITSADMENNNGYRYYRYINYTNHGDVADIEFFKGTEADKSPEKETAPVEEKVEDKVEEVVENVTEAAEDVAEAVGDAAGEAVDAVKDAANEVAEAAKSGCGSFIGGGIVVIVSILGAAWVAGRKH